jgi:CRP-like cAMP-binding protein
MLDMSTNQFDVVEYDSIAELMIEPKFDLDVVEIIQQMKAFASLSVIDIQKMIALCRWKSVPAANKVVESGNESQDVLLLLKGQVRVLNFSNSGSPISSNDVESGEIIGEFENLDSEIRSTSIFALSQCWFAVLDAKYAKSLV